ncbi:hypothetical protein CRG98_041575, partial [Punica granatum]
MTCSCLLCWSLFFLGCNFFLSCSTHRLFSPSAISDFRRIFSLYSASTQLKSL